MQLELKKKSWNEVLLLLLVLYISCVYFSVAIANILLGISLFVFILGIIIKRIKLNFNKEIIKLYILLIIPFVLTLISMLNTNNTDVALRSLWLRIPIIFVPFMIINMMKIKKKTFLLALKIYVIFSLGAVLLTVYNTLIIYIEYRVVIDPQHITKITPIQHPYFGILELISIITVYKFRMFSKNKWIYFSIIALISIGIILSTSRLAFGLLGLFYIYILYTKISNKLVYLTIIILGVIVGGYLIQSNEKFQKKITNTTSYWESPRIWLWHNSYKVVKHSKTPLLGIGIGDYYRVKRDPNSFIHTQSGTYGYNPHNQYIEFIITNGILGLFYIFSMLYLVYYTQLYKKRYSFFIMIIIAVFSFTECIFGRQFGVQLYAFFTPFSILLLLNKKKHQFQE